MEIGKFHNEVNDPQFAQLPDNILDAVLALKARLKDSNMDSNSIVGISISAAEPAQAMPEVKPNTKAPKGMSSANPRSHTILSSPRLTPLFEHLPGWYPLQGLHKPLDCVKLPRKL